MLLYTNITFMKTIIDIGCHIYEHAYVPGTFIMILGYIKLTAAVYSRPVSYFVILSHLYKLP